MSEFMQTLERAAQSLRESAQKIDRPQTQHKAYIAVLAGVDLFMRFVNRSSHDFSVKNKLSYIYIYICISDPLSLAFQRSR